MKLEAACSLKTMPSAGAHPTRRIGADASLSCTCMAAGLSPSELGGDKITIRLEGLTAEQIARVLSLVSALKEPDADSRTIVDEIKRMQED